LYEEAAFIAYYFNWSHDDVLSLPHWERKRWCEEISRINETVNEDGAGVGQPSMDPSMDDVPVLDLDEDENPFE